MDSSLVDWPWARVVGIGTVRSMQCHQWSSLGQCTWTTVVFDIHQQHGTEPELQQLNIRLFADDTLLYHRIQSQQDQIQMQKDTLVHWSNTWCMELNSLAPGKFEWNFRYIIFKRISVIDGWGISCEIALIWMSLDCMDDQSTLVQVMALCHQATSHCLSQCWLRSLSPYRVTRPQWVNIKKCYTLHIMTTSQNKQAVCIPYSMSGKELERVRYIKYLSVTINNHLSWEPHISATAAKAHSPQPRSGLNFTNLGCYGRLIYIYLLLRHS